MGTPTSRIRSRGPQPPTPSPRSGETLAVFGKIGLLSFGGPAAQIALMHSVLVEERGWLDERAFLSALELLHAAAGSRGDAARDLRRLASARHQGRARRGAVVRRAGRAARAGAVDLLRGLRQDAGGRGAVHRREGRGAGDRARGADPRRTTGAARAARLGRRRRRLRRHLLLRAAVSRWSSPPPHSPAISCARQRPRAAARTRCRRSRWRRRCAPPPSGSPSGSCRCSSSPPCSAAAMFSRSSRGSSPSSRW